MPQVKFTAALKRFYPELEEVSIDATNIAEVLAVIEQQYPKISTYLTDEHGELRKHVNIFIGNTMIKDRVKLQDEVQASDEVYIMQALSGG